jgi:hypothetical protein
MSDRLSLSQVAAPTAYAAAMAGGQLPFKTAALGSWRWSARRAERWLSAQRVFFRCSHSLRRLDPSVGLDPELYPRSRASIRSSRLYSRSRQRLVARFCRTVVDAVVIIVLILCWLFFIAG